MLGAGVETPIRPYHRHLPVFHTHSSHRILSHTPRILRVPKAKQQPKQERRALLTPRTGTRASNTLVVGGWEG